MLNIKRGDSMVTVESSDQSEFNAGIATLMRLDAIKKKMINDNLEENHIERYKDLATYYLELVSIIKDKDEGIYNPLFNTHKKNYQKLKGYWEKKAINIPMELIDWLDTYEMKLRNLEQSYGLNIPKKLDGRYSMGGGRK